MDIMRQGESGDCVYVIERGEFDVCQHGHKRSNDSESRTDSMMDGGGGGGGPAAVSVQGVVDGDPGDKVDHKRGGDVVVGHVSSCEWVNMCVRCEFGEGA